jgi:YD repeat-containing protein
MCGPKRFGVFVGIGLALLLSASSLLAQSGVQYIYDELGRLVGVIDTSGNAAGYSYDAVGNVQAIARYTSSQASVLQFTPKTGPVGTVVTISGTGFSTTLSQDTVSFNGTAATITSATANQIVTTVPSGATTGTITVTSPAGSVTPSTPFTITASNGTPTITSFTPTIGISATSVSVTGTNFDPTPSNDEPEFNVILAAVPTSVTSTGMTLAVPSNGTSGRLSVTTANGRAISTSDFFVPPSPYVAANVGYTGRVTLGNSTSVGISTGSEIGLLLFDGTAGQRVFINTSNNTYGYHLPTLTLLSPFGATVASGVGGGYIDTVTLPQTGTYTILANPSTTTGSITLSTYSVPPDLTGTIAIGGSPVTVTPSVGQNADLTFSGTSGQTISLTETNVTDTTEPYVSVLNPDGTTLEGPTTMGSGSMLPGTTISQTGTYTVLVAHQGSGSGSATTTLYNAAPQILPITPGGSSVTVNFNTPGQNAELTFSGSSSQRISMYVTTSNIGTYVSVLNPDTSTLISSTPLYTGYSQFFGATTLSQTGTYTVNLNATAMNPTSWPSGGSVTVTVYSVPADVTGTITPSGSAVTANITTPGQKAKLTFSGTAGQSVSLNLTSVTITSSTVSILNPDGTTLTSTGVSTSGAFITPQTLPSTGTYTISLSPYSIDTGNMTFNLYNVVNDNTSTTIGASAITVTLNTPGQIANITFSGTSGQQMTIQIASSTFNAGGSITLTDPNGHEPLAGYLYSGSYNESTITLSVTGTYTITISPGEPSTGSLQLDIATP